MKHSIWGKRALAAVGVAALTLPAMAGTATAAITGAPSDGGTIAIHKYDNSGGEGAAATGDVMTPPQGANPLNDVSFTITPICPKTATTTPLDLSVTANWSLIEKVKTPADLDGAGLQLCAAGTTGIETVKTAKVDGADGVAKYTYTSPVLLQIEETAAPSNVQTKAKTFLLTAPLAKEDSSGWIANIHVYPKNVLKFDTTKVIKDNGTVIGGVSGANDKVTYEMTASLPKFADKATAFKVVTVTDTLGADLDGTKAVVNSVTVNGKTLTETTDYTVTKPTTAPGDLVITLTEAGLAKVTQLNKVVVNITVPLKADTNTGNLKNTFKLHSEDNAGDNGGTTGTTDTTPNTGSEAVVNRGTFKITKVDAADKSVKINGAVFNICEAASASATAGCKDTNTDTDGVQPKYIGEAAADGSETAAEDFTTAGTDAAKGTVTGTLLIAKTTETDSSAPATSKWFCAVEKTAPENYIKMKDPVCFELTTAGTTAKPTDVEIENHAYNQWIPGLPVTGAQGLMLLTLGGAALTAIAVGSAIVIRRRQH